MSSSRDHAPSDGGVREPAGDMPRFIIERADFKRGKLTLTGTFAVDDARKLAGLLSLLGAAPDMLKALKELHKKTVIGTDAERRAALHGAWAAITKAVGQ